MKSTLLTLFLIVIGLSFSQAQTVVDNFDSSAVNNIYQINLEQPSVATISDNHTDFHEGTGSLNFNAVLRDIHSWGTFAEIQKQSPEGEYFDWSTSDTLRMWIKVYEAPTLPENMFFRFAVMDQPTSEDDAEMYVYENAAALDVQTNWYELVIPFVEIPSDGTINPSDTGFTLTPSSWGIPYNNMMLDKNKIVSFQITAVTNAQIVDSLKIGYDNLVRTGNVAIPFVFFNGLAVQGPLSQFVWGQSTLEVDEGSGATPGTNSLKWTQGDEWGNGWTGAGWDITDPYNMGGAWAVDSLKFKMKAPSGTGPIRFQFESGGSSGKIGYVMTPIGDDQWHDYALPLRDFVLQDGTTFFDSTSVNVFQVMAEESAQAGRVIYMDDLWTGSPVIDVVAPPPPANISVVQGTYVNSILWDDVPGEAGETYRIYYSENPITDITAPGVEVVISDLFAIGENVGLLDHLLFAPATDQSVSYYYAMTCTDDAGNTSVVSQNSPIITNTAKGVTPINPTAPTNFAADGNLSEWAGITPFRMFISDGTGHVVTNTTIDNDDDLSVLAYVAMDNDYLYVAFDVVDDVVSTDTTQSSWLIDSPDLYIGLYNWHGAPHNSYKRGTEPDYHIRFGRNAALIDNLGSFRVLEQGDPNYYWDERFSPGYVVEAKISFADLAAAGGDDLFSPLLGMRIPIDFSVNDNDEPGTGNREGIMTYSPYSEDHSYEHPYRWLFTWIGDQWVGVEDNVGEVTNYNLEQNYPNPFNPTTVIKYSLKESGKVTLKIYDMLGKEVMTLVNETQNAGSHLINFNGNGLASGVYFYKLDTGSFTQVKKMILMK